MKMIVKNENGFAAVIALIMVAMLTLIGLAALSGSDDELSIASNELQEMKAFYAAEAGMEIATSMLIDEFDSTGRPPTIMPIDTREINNCQVTFTTADDGPAEQRVLNNGTLAGLHALVKSFTIDATALNSVDNTSIELTQNFETGLVPIFQFAVFYNNNLEIAPGPEMTLLGRVHTNGNLYIQSNNSLSIDSYVTTTGSIIHGRHPESGMSTSNGDVKIKDADGNYVNMKLPDNSWMDANRSTWYDSSVSMWDGRVQDSTHGQRALNLPLASSAGGDPHKIIERSTGGNVDSYEEKASLKFIDQQALQLVGGTWTDVTADMVTKGIITFSNNKFYDARELKNVDVMELDMTKLDDEGYYPSNGVIYYSDQDVSRDYPALRLNNADELGDAITIASENPVYTNGNYNSTNKKPAAILADAVTFLSVNWNDANSALNKSSRVAANTTVNASYLTGNVPSSGGNYSGGFENLPRFLETWTNKIFTWYGSAVNLWAARQAIGLWGSYYSPPIRNWYYDADLDDPANLPPATPVVQVSQRTGWKQSYVGFD